MKNIIVLSAVVLFFAAACNNAEKTAENKDTSIQNEAAQASSSSQAWLVNPKLSSITWTGTKPGKEHIGTVSLIEGTLSLEYEKITAGNFSIDMTSIVETSNADDPKSQKKLVNHLKSNDFFSVDLYPLSRFVITEVKDDSIFGNLTIKNITKGIKFPANITLGETSLSALASFEIDRTDWDIYYKSGKKLKDKLIDNVIGDKVAFKVTLIANKK